MGALVETKTELRELILTYIHQVHTTPNEYNVVAGCVIKQLAKNNWAQFTEWLSERSTSEQSKQFVLIRHRHPVQRNEANAEVP